MAQSMLFRRYFGWLQSYVRLKFWAAGGIAVVGLSSAWAQTAGQLPLLVGTGGSGMSFSVPVQTLLFFTAL